MDRGSVVLLLVLALLAVLLVLGGAPLATPDEAGDYDWTTVTVRDANGTQLATVDVRIADTRDKRYVGLSDTESLEMGEGMLFVHEREDRYTYVMRDMDFPLDIVFVRTNGTISRIHHAPIPEEIEGGNGAFEGTGRYVLEVPRGWANATGVDVGDRVDIPETGHEG